MIPTFTAMSGWIVTLVLVALLIYKIAKRRWDVLNFNTIFLVGYIQFFSFSIVLFAVLSETAYFENYNPTPQAWNFLALVMPIFIIAYFIAYRWSARWVWPQKLIPPMDLPVTYSGMIMILSIVIGGVLFTTLLGFASFGEFFIIMVRPALAAFAVGLAVALVIKQPANILFWGVFAGTFLVGAVISTTFQTGRRDVLGIFLAVIWMTYWGWLRYRPMARQFLILGAGGAIAIIFLFAYTNMRGSIGVQNATIEVRQQQLQDLVTGKVNPFALEQVIPVIHQDTGVYSAYIMEEYPATYPLIPFNGLYFFVTNPIPRILFEDKPVALGIQLQKHLGANGNLGVGIIGHGWAEGMMIGVLAYAVFFGILYRALDNSLRNYAGNPYFLAAMGSALGQMLALPRGEVSLFLVLWFYGTVSIAFILYLSKFFLGAFLGATAEIPFGPNDPKNAAALGEPEPELVYDDESGLPEDLTYGDESFVNAHSTFTPGAPQAAPQPLPHA